MANATTSEEWRGYAKKLDKYEGLEEWKRMPQSHYYDHNLILARLVKLQQLESETELMHFMETGMIRNLGGISNYHLFNHCHTGTKHLIEEYNHEIVQGLYRIEHQSKNKKAVKEYFSDMMHVFGRSALFMHGGASFGLCHLGVVKALYNSGMLPDIICGSYIGALIAALVCTTDDTGLERIFRGDIDLEVLRHQPGSGWRRKMTRLLKYGKLFDIQIIEQAARNNLGDVTFLEAFKRSGRVLNITVKSRRKLEVPLLLNYMTAPDVVVWSAACASCATPGMYDTCTLFIKDKSGSLFPWHGAEIRLDPTTIAHKTEEAIITRLTELFGVTNLIVSQVPSFFSFQAFNLDEYKSTWFGAIMKCILNELSHRLYQAAGVGLIPRRLLALQHILRMPTIGDVRISPVILFRDIRHIFRTPDREFIRYCIAKGERATWRRLSQLEVRCAIEFALHSLLLRATRNDKQREELISLYRRSTQPF
jgi:TAG lipase / lysophosphatidylethanolamine acyltransferase